LNRRSLLLLLLLINILSTLIKRLDKGHGNARVTVDVEVDRVEGA
jgi:hypothetical protein